MKVLKLEVFPVLSAIILTYGKHIGETVPLSSIHTRKTIHTNLTKLGPKDSQIFKVEQVEP